MRKIFLPVLFCLFLSGCSAFTSTLSYEAPKPYPIDVKPWRIIDRAPPGYPGGTLRLYEFGSDPKTFNPITANEQGSNDITEQIFSPLLDVNFKTGKVVPGLAYKWTHSKDGKVWMFYLRKGLRWSDGRPLTADDIVFTFQAIYDPKVANPVRDVAQINGKPIRCEKVDDTTVRFILPGVYGPFEYLMGTIYPVPKHILGAALANGTFSSAYGVSTPPNQLVSSGAFRIKEYVPQQRITLERNPYYYAKDIKGQRLPYLDHIVVLFVPDLNTAFLKFLSGELDAFTQFPPKFYDDLKAGEKRGDYHVLDLGPTAETSFVIFNENSNSKYLSPVKYRWFTNKLFRQAVAYSIDEKTMIRLAYLGYGYPGKEDFHPLSPFYDPKVRGYEYNPEKAKELFSQAGFRWENGKMFDDRGNRVEFNLITNSGNIQRQINGELFKESLERIGIAVNFHPIDFNEMITKLDYSFDYEAVLIGLINTGGDIEPSNDQNVWLSSGFTHMWNPRQKKPATPWEADIDKLVWEGIGTLDLQKRRKIYGRIEEILYGEEVPMILLPVPADLYAFKDYVGNADPTYEGRFYTNGPDDMILAQAYIKKEKKE